MRAQHRPELVLRKMTVGDQRRGRVTPERRQPRSKPYADLLGEITPRHEERHERLVGRARGAGHEVPIAQHRASQRAPFLETQRQRGPRCDAHRQHPQPVELR